MEKTPASMRKCIGIFGRTNAGKSSLFNAILGQSAAIVSDVSGTTTDPVSKPMELVGYGAVTLVDTAGLGDFSELGSYREARTRDILRRCDLVIFAEDVTERNEAAMDFGAVPFVKVYTKCDKVDKAVLNDVKSSDADAVFVGNYSDAEISQLRKRIVDELMKQSRDDDTILGNILTAGDVAVLVIPIDSAAPKGRLILPQVQVLRDCLDNDIRAICTTPNMLAATLDDTKADLVICDSQIFGQVERLVPRNVRLTSFSMLLANKSGKINQLIEGTNAISKLNDGDNILVLEACTHNTTHEDIGKVKIPMLLQKAVGKKLIFTHLNGFDIDEDLSKYRLIIQCGGCMINKKTVQNRLDIFEKNNIPVTNYGVILAYLNGILDRAAQVFVNK